MAEAVRERVSHLSAARQEFSKPIRDLLGYRIHRPNLGGYEGQDPSVLFETDPHTLAAIPAAVDFELQAHYEKRAGDAGGWVDDTSGSMTA